MKIYSADKSELMQVAKIERDGNDLVLKGKVFGTMPMSARLSAEARAALKLLTPGMILFLLTLPFRKG